MKKKCIKILYSLVVGKRRVSDYNIVIIQF